MKKLISAVALALSLMIVGSSGSFAASLSYSSYFSGVADAAEKYKKMSSDYWSAPVDLIQNDYEVQITRLITEQYRAGKKSGTILLEGLTESDVPRNGYGLDVMVTTFADTFTLDPNVEYQYNPEKKQILIEYSGDDIYSEARDTELTGQAKVTFDGLVNAANSKGSDREKLAVLNDWFYNNVSYNYDYSQSLNGPKEVLEKHTGVCQGFSELTQLFADAVGIPSIAITMSADHLVPLVYVEGKWCVLDTTNTASVKKNQTKPAMMYRNHAGEIVYKHVKERAFLVPLDDMEWMLYYLNGRGVNDYSVRSAELTFYANSNYYGLGKYTSFKPADNIDKYVRPVSEWVAPKETAPSTGLVPIEDNTPIEPPTYEEPMDPIGSESTPSTGGLTGGGSISFGPGGITSVGTMAKPSTNKFMVEGKQVSINSYLIGGNNYVKLRDIAQAINNTSKNFEITWNGKLNAIEMKSKTRYTVVGGELVRSYATADKKATNSTSKIYADGKLVNVKAYTIDGNNYFLLRDLGSLFNFGVAWDGKTQSVIIDPSVGYTK